jgi:hypothetical protein
MLSQGAKKQGFYIILAELAAWRETFFICLMN